MLVAYTRPSGNLLQFATENGPDEIVSLPMKKMVIVHRFWYVFGMFTRPGSLFVLYSRWPSANYPEMRTEHPFFDSMDPTDRTVEQSPLGFFFDQKNEKT